MPKKIALLAGGYSGEYVISMRSAATIAAALDPEKYSVYQIEVTRGGWQYVDKAGAATAIDKNDFTLPLPEGCVRFDAAFIAIHGTPGEDGKLQGYFDMLGIPYVGSSAVVSALTFNKSYCNAVVRESGAAAVARSVQIPSARETRAYAAAVGGMRFPLFVKPAEGGSSLGVTKLGALDGLDAAVAKAGSEGGPVIVEEFIGGRELTIGAFRQGGEVVVLPPTEILSGNEFFDYEAKYTAGAAREITPADLPAADLAVLQQTVRRLYALLGCRGVVRMDFILEEASQQFFFLEVNTIPGQSDASIVPQQVRAAGRTLTDFYGALLDEVLKPTHG